MKNITQLEFNSVRDLTIAEGIAKKLGYTQTVYTSSSEMVGLFCLRDRPTQKAGCIIKTKEFSFLFVQDMEDLNMAS